MDLQHISVKMFTVANADFNVTTMIPVFHGWIQRSALEGVKPIDVADYSHVYQGPGVLLVCQEGQFSMEQSGGRLGLRYANKHLASGGVKDRIAEALSKVLAAAELLEAEAALKGKLSFGRDEFLVQIDDKLFAPNTEKAFNSLKNDLEEAFASKLSGGGFSLEHIPKAQTGLTVKVAQK